MYTLYGGPASYFTGKARAYLRFKGVDYKEEMATYPVIQQLLYPRTGFRMVPVVFTPEDEVLQDTTNIIDTLEIRLGGASVYPTGPKQLLTALLFEVYGDEWLQVPAMHYRWSFPRQNLMKVLGEFGDIGAPFLPENLRWLGGVPMAAFFGVVHRPAMGISFANYEAIEEHTEWLFAELEKHFCQHDFLLGSRPSIGDYGLMGPMYAHLYRDNAPSEVMRRIAPALVSWVERMNEPPVDAGDFLPQDEVPETLFPILRQMFREHVPILQDCVRRTEGWVADHPGAQIPRFVGWHKWQLNGVSAWRLATSYSQWMFQRPLFYYQELEGTDREAADGLLREIGGFEGMQFEIRQPIGKRSNMLHPVVRNEVERPALADSRYTARSRGERAALESGSQGGQIRFDLRTCPE